LSDQSRNAKSREGDMMIKIDVLFLDCQNDFFPPGGALAIPGASSIRSNLEKILRFAESNRLRILLSEDMHINGDPEFKIFPPHCTRGTEGSKLIKEIEINLKGMPLCIFKPIGDGEAVANPPLKAGTLPSQDEQNGPMVFEKNVIDIFLEGSFASYIDARHPDVVLLCGVATDYCIKAAALGLREKGIKVYLLLDAIAGIFEEGTRDALEMMRKAGVQFITTERLTQLSYLNAEFGGLLADSAGKRSWVPLQ
jgi:nicotinamidase/pyrazinamidase